MLNALRILDKPAVTVVLFAVSLAAAGGFYLHVTDLNRENSDRLQQTVQLLSRFEQLAAQRPALETRFVEMQEAGATHAALFQGATAAIAGANMQASLKSLVETTGGSVRSLRIISGSQEPSGETGSYLAPIDIEIEFDLPALNLPHLLYAAERHDPFLIFKRLQVSSPETQVGAPGGSAMQTTLFNSWSIRGYRWENAQ